MNPRTFLLGRTGLLLAAVLTLALFFAQSNLPITQAEDAPIENVMPFQSNSQLGATAQCVFSFLTFYIPTGDLPIELTGTGPGLPQTISALGTSIRLTGPGIWTGVTVTELGGDQQTIPLGDFSCDDSATIDLQVMTTCRDDILMFILDGDGPIIVEGTGLGLPITTLYGGYEYAYGPGTWTNLTVRETSGNEEQITLPDITCPSNVPAVQLAVYTGCNGSDGWISVESGDYPVRLQDNGGVVPPFTHLTSSAPFTLTGPGTWTGMWVDELGGDRQQYFVPNFSCPAPIGNLQATMTCDNGDLVVEILSGDPFFAIIGTGPGLPFSTMETGVYRFPGPAVWTNLNVHEPVGNPIEHINFGTIECTGSPSTPQPPNPPDPPGNLRATMTCDHGDLVVDIRAGDPFFAIIGDGPGLPTSTMETGVYRFPGPAVWTNLNVHEPVGDDIIRFGTLDCRTTTPTETPARPPAPIILPAYVPEVVMELPMTTPQVAYDAPGGHPIHNPDGSLLTLPQDADGNGYDTFIILDAEMVDGEAWVGLYLGGPNLGWLPLASLTVPTE